MTLNNPRKASFADPNTEFFLPKFPTHCGDHWMDEPTGVVICLACLESDKNIDHIDHESTCPQRHVHSRWWRDHHSG